MTLTRAALGDLNLAKQAGLVLGATLFIAVAAQISVPFFPVPLTLQTLAVLLVGFTLGARLGAIALLAYLAEGAMGLPVFANFNNAAAFAGPTAGFLFGFVAMAWIAGKAADMGVRGVVGTALVAILASAVLYIPGLAWPLGVAEATGISAGWAGAGFAQTLAWFATPFLLGDVVKAILAALIVSGGWAMLSKR